MAADVRQGAEGLRWAGLDSWAGRAGLGGAAGLLPISVLSHLAKKLADRFDAWMLPFTPLDMHTVCNPCELPMLRIPMHLLPRFAESVGQSLLPRT